MKKEQLYTVKEVRKYTGLTRKQLYDYKSSIPPVDTENEAGYKIYDQKGLEKLLQAALYAELGATPQRINDIFGNNYDSQRIISDLIDEAKEQRQKLDDIITIAEYYKEYNLNLIPANPFSMFDLHTVAESYRNELQKMESLNKDGKFDKLITEFIEGFASFDKKDLGCKKLHEYIRKYEKKIGKELNTSGRKYIITIGIHLYNENPLCEWVEDLAGRGKASLISKAIIEYANNDFSEPFADITEKFGALKGKDHKNKEVQKCICELQDLFMSCYGVEDISEIYAFLQSSCMTMKQSESKETIEVYEYILGILEKMGDF